MAEGEGGWTPVEDFAPITVLVALLNQTDNIVTGTVKTDSSAW